MAISNDDRSDARRMAAELGESMIVLSDPSMSMIARYGMGRAGASMAEMGYVVIDRAGRVRVRRVDPLFGAHVAEILNALQEGSPGTDDRRKTE